MFALFALPWVRKCLEGAFVLASLAALTWTIYDRGMQTGRRDEASSQVRASKTEFDRIESAFAQQLSAANTTADKYHDVVAVLLQQAQQLASKAQAASVAGIADKQKLAEVPNSQLRQDLEGKLGGPLTSPEILRVDDSIVTDYPHVETQIAALSDQVNKLQAAETTKDQELAATAQERDSAIEAHNQLLPLYVQAYNAATVRHRHFWCLWLCKSKLLKLPAPLALGIR